MAEIEEHWTEEALCSRPQNEAVKPLFFADEWPERYPARNLCFECPVRKECLTDALKRREIHGVWGGCDENDLRRTLQVDAKGKPLSRARYPNCPFCKARPSQLNVVSACQTSDGKTKHWVQCSTCAFKWAAATSVAAVRAYWRERRRKEQQRIRASAPTGRLPRPQTASAVQSNVTHLPMPKQAENAPESIAASGYSASAEG